MVVFLFSKINTWGYSTINFFSPMSRYASAGGGSVSASREFKQMVKALHSSGIEVVTLNYTISSGSLLDIFISWFYLILCYLKSYIYLLVHLLNLILTQVILDVVYNHTNEADDAHPYTTSFRGIDNKVISICNYYFDRWC